MNDVPPPPPPYGAVPPGGGGPDVGAALSYGFSKYFANLGPVLGVIAVSLVAQILFQIIQLSVSSLVVRGLFSIVGFVVSAMLSIGVYKTALMLTAGETPTVGKAFTYDRWGEWISFAIVYSLIVAVGFILCIIPGLIALAFFGMAPYFFLDRGMTLGQALTASREAATSRGFAFPVLLSVIVGALGLIACFIGVFVTAPAAYIAVAFLYRNASGQPVAP